MPYIHDYFDRPISPWLARCIIAIAALVCTSDGAQNLLWSEEFNTGSVPDPAIWSYDLGTGNWGWGNGELQSYTSNTNNVRVESGNLIITALRNGNNFTSGRIKTLNKLTFQYGTVEARIKTPDLANGLWPAFWTLGNNYPTVGWPKCGEIDVMEMGYENAINAGIVNRRVGSHAHWGSIVDGGWPNYGNEIDYASDINDTFVVYRMEWTPYSITTYINNQQIWTMGISSIQEFQKPHFLILNLAVGGQLTGRMNASGITAPFPAEYAIDYIRIYDNGHTVLGGTGAPPPNSPPVFTVDPITRPNTSEIVTTGSTYYLNDIIGSATDVNEGDTLTYSKVSGPAWLEIWSDGYIEGFIDTAQEGLNSWTVRVSDGKGGTDTATLEIMVDGDAMPPVLSIQMAGAGMEILWPTSYSTYNLYGSTNLSPPAAWSPVTNTPVLQEDDWMVTLPIAEAPQFFRLQSP